MRPHARLERSLQRLKVASSYGMFGFVEGVIRWLNRVVGYAFILVTDRYPPFSLRQREVPPPTPASPLEPQA